MTLRRVFKSGYVFTLYRSGHQYISTATNLITGHIDRAEAFDDPELAHEKFDNLITVYSEA